MKKYFLMAVAAIAALSSCTSDNEILENVSNGKALVFTATMEGVGDTRATFDATNKCAAWEAGDKININGYLYSAQTSGTTTTFTADDGDATGSEYVAYFPQTLLAEFPVLPSNISETWADGKFNMPMYAKSTTTNLSFKNLCGVLKITVKNNQLTSVKSIKVSSANHATSGNFSAIVDNAPDLDSPDDITKTVTVTYTDAVTTDADGKVFYVALPPQTYQDLKIELDPDGNGFTKSMTTKSGVNITIARNKIYPITFADNAPATTGKAKATIGGSEVDVNWVQLWEDGPKFAEYNVGASAPEEYGFYFAWGYTEGCIRNSSNDGWVLASDETTTKQFNTEYFPNLDESSFQDAVTATWGSNWQMPTKEDYENLISNCDINYVDGCNGVTGVWFKGKNDYSDNSIFLPAHGFGGNSVLYNSSGTGIYWTRPIDSDTQYNLYLYAPDWEAQEHGMYDGDADIRSFSKDTGSFLRAVLK